MKNFLLILGAIISFSMFAADLTICGQVQQVLIDGQRGLSMIVIHQDNGNDYATVVSAKIENTALALANTSILNKDTKFCGDVISAEFVNVRLTNLKN